MKSIRFTALVAALLALVALPTRAMASVDIATSDLTVTMGEGTSAHLALAITYVAVGEVKDAGFKYVGKKKPTKVVAHTPTGEPLDVKAALEPSSGEWRIDFALPAPNSAKSGQTAVIEFDQDLGGSGLYGWFGVAIEVPWAHVFKLTVDRFVDHVVGDVSLDGFTCASTNGARTCTRESDDASPLRFRIVESRARDLGLAIAGAIWAVVFTVLMARREHARLLREKGVLPPREEPVQAPQAQAGYRAPPPVVTSSEPEKPVLTSSDAANFYVAANFALVGPLLLEALTSLFTASPIPLGFVAGGVVVLTSLAASLGLLAHRPGLAALFGLPVVVVGAYLVAGAILAGLAAMFSVVVLVILAIAKATKNGTPSPIRSGSGMSSSYSSSSSYESSSYSGSTSSCGGGGGSSCGGGGGSSCGGGGGSSCGGGGGGGGCGG